MKCKPCKVTFENVRYRIDQDGTVTPLKERQADGSWVDVTHDPRPSDPQTAAQVRAEAARQRRNIWARERHAALTSLGLKRCRDGRYE